MGILAPILTIGVYLMVIEKGTIMLNNDIDVVFKYMIPALGVICISIGFILFKKRLNEIKIDEPIDAKLFKYKAITIQRVALIEGIAVFSAVAFILTLNNLYILYALLALLCLVPAYPSLNKLTKDLRILPGDKNDEPDNSDKPKNFFVSNPWIIIPALALLVFINYNSIKDLIRNKAVFPTVQADCGTIKDSIYKNEYLGWTIRIPSGYSVIPISVIEANEKRGNEIYGTTPADEKPIRLLNISNGQNNLQSALNVRALFPDFTSEDEYLEAVDKNIQDTRIDSITIEKTDQGTMIIDKIEFKYIEYLMNGPANQIQLLFLSKFDKYYMLDISLSILDPVEGKKLRDHLKRSTFNWK